MQVYWSSVFLLPKATIKKMEQLMRNFLWNQGDSCRGKAKVSWKTICQPKEHGGLGVKSLDVWNKVLMATHLWKVITGKDSLWVKWIHTYRLKGRNIWDVPIKQDASWGWRKILLLRKQLKNVLIWTVGDGCSISFWYDNWGTNIQWDNVVTKRQIKQAGFTDELTLSEMVIDCEWNWPAQWRVNLERPQLFDRQDICGLLNKDGEIIDFSVKNLWKTLLPEGTVVLWNKIVWFPQRIPRHSFILWLAASGKLRTQDKMKAWNTNIQPCFLCNTADEDHNHLFFGCPYSTQCWFLIRQNAAMSIVSPCWNDIMDFLTPRANANSAWSVTARLVLAASVYYIWQERNNRFFGKLKRTPEQLVQVIKEVIRMKLSTLIFRNSKNVLGVANTWKIALTIRDKHGKKKQSDAQ